MLRAYDDPTNPVSAAQPTGDKYIDRLTVPAHIPRQQLMAWLKTPAGQQWLEQSKGMNVTTAQGWGPQGAQHQPMTAPAEEIQKWVKESGWSPLDEPDPPLMADMGPDYYQQWNSLWKAYRQQYPTWTREQLRTAVHQTIMQKLGQGQKEFESRFGPPKPPPPPMSEGEQLRQLIGEGRKQMESELQKQRAVDQLKHEFGQRLASDKQDQEVLNSGRKWRWNGNNYVYDDTDEAQALRDASRQKALDDQVAKNQAQAQRQQQMFQKPKAGTYQPVPKPGQAQSMQPQPQGTPYGFVDQNGDGINDYDQLGPSYAPIALPPGHRPNTGTKGNMSPIGPNGERWMF